ncbi:type IV fimbrial biogenesis protein FimT [Gammaproteobacteria bacterium]
MVTWAYAGVEMEPQAMNRISGFTLIETMMVVTVMAIVLTTGIPSLRAAIRSSYAVTHTNAFLSSLSLARNEAIKRGQRVVVCKSLSNICQNETFGWEQGWMVFVDSNNNASLDEDELPLYAHESLGGGNTLQGNQNVRDYISYSPEGVAKMKSGAFQAGTFTFGLCVGHKQNTIVISKTGRARVQKIAC